MHAVYIKVEYKNTQDFLNAIVAYQTKKPIIAENLIIQIPRQLYTKNLLNDNNPTKTLLLESLVKPGTTPADLIQLLQDSLDTAGVTDEIIIIDPYFYASIKGPQQQHKTQAYTNLLKNTLQKYKSQIRSMKIITDASKQDNTMRQIVHTAINAAIPSASITDTYSSDIHDRFWITNNRKAGILVGTSLNHLGNKYALVCQLDATDVQEIITSLSSLL